MLLYKFPSPPLNTNAILIAPKEGGLAAVIDPAWESTERILRQADQDRLEIVKIFLTHSHWDHIADAQLLKSKTGATVHVHLLDAQNAKTPGKDGVLSYLPHSILPVEIDSFFQDGDILSVGLLEIEVIHTPGHSPGSVCFYLRKEGILISGDTLFADAYGRVDLATGEPDKMKDSLKKLSRLPSSTRVIPGHGVDTEIGKEAWIGEESSLKF